MCCRKRANRDTLRKGQQAQSGAVKSIHNNNIEVLDAPPAYDEIDQKSADSGRTLNNIEEKEVGQIQAPRTQASSESLDSNVNIVSPRQGRRTAKREHRTEQRQLKREYRQEKRELRAEYRDERREKRHRPCGPVGLLVKGISNLLKH